GLEIRDFPADPDFPSCALSSFRGACVHVTKLFIAFLSDFLMRGSRNNKTNRNASRGKHTGTCLASEGAMQPSQCGSSHNAASVFHPRFAQAQKPAPIAC